MNRFGGRIHSCTVPSRVPAKVCEVRLVLAMRFPGDEPYRIGRKLGWIERPHRQLATTSLSEQLDSTLRN